MIFLVVDFNICRTFITILQFLSRRLRRQQNDIYRREQSQSKSVTKTSYVTTLVLNVDTIFYWNLHLEKFQFHKQKQNSMPTASRRK
jgi:hypothetical protein